MPGPVQMQSPLAVSRRSPAADSGKMPAKGQSSDELKKVCRDFESIFVNQLMQQMRRTIPKEGLLGGGKAEEIYTTMQDAEMAKNISQQRGIGLADVLYRQLSRLTHDGSQMDETRDNEPVGKVTTQK